MTELPLIRFQRGNSTHARILYEGPDSDGTVLKFTQDDPILVVIGPDGRLYPNVVVTRLPHMGRIGIELKPSGGLPTLRSKQDGWGGALFWPIDPETLLRTIGDRPITIPEDTPIGSLMLFGVMFITVTTIYERRWAPPGWEIVSFSMFNSVIPSGALPSANSIAFAVYQRTCQAGDPGSKVWGYAINTDQPYPNANDDPPQDPWTGFREGDWLGQLRIYDHATIGRTDKVKTHEIEWDWGPITTDPRDNPGATESDGTPIVADPAIRTPHNLLGTVGARQVEFFMVNQWGWFDIDLANGGQNKMITGEIVHPIEARDPINKARIVSEGPFIMMASEEFVDTASGGELILLPDPHWTPPLDMDAKTWIHVALVGPHHTYQADVQIHKFKSPLQLFDPQLGVFDKVVFFIRPVQIKGNLPTRLEHSIEEVQNFDAFPLVGIHNPPDARRRTGGELDGDEQLQYSASPTKVGPPGPLGRDINWVTVAHWAGGPLSDFTIPDQWDHGNIVAGPQMQVVDGVLTTADTDEVRFIFQGSGNPGDYVGDKYAAIWTGAPPSADQTKLRVKLSSMVGNHLQQFPFVGKLFGIACNMQDRQQGIAFYLSDGVLGWTRDLRRLGQVQWAASVTDGGQEIPRLITYYWDAAETHNFDTDGTPVSYSTDTSFPEFLSNVLIIEMWRNGNTLSLGIWEDDPDTGGQPVWRDDRDLTLSTIDQANFAPGVSHHWGVTAAALDPTWHSNSGVPMGFAEFTMYRAP